jgi:hypothetical protein
MKRTVQNLARLYGLLLHLYPRGYRSEYGQEMQRVFCLRAGEAAQRDAFSLIVLGLQELRDLPRAVIHEHWRDARRNTEEARMPIESGATAWGGTVNATSPFRRLSRLWAAWVIVNTMAATLAIVVWMLVLFMIGSTKEPLKRYWLIVAIPTFSILISTTQRLVLYYMHLASRGWIVASLLGWMSGSLVALVADRTFSCVGRNPFEPLTFFILGLLVGVAQWCVIKRRSRVAVLWIPASTLGWSFLGFIMRGGEFTGFCPFALIGALPAMVTGVVLVVMMYFDRESLWWIAT